MQKAIIRGNLGSDPESEKTKDGTPVCRLSVAVNVKVGDEWMPTWWQVSAWGKQGKACAEHLRKGDTILCMGRITLNDWTTKEGEIRTSLQMNADSVDFLITESTRERIRSGGSPPDSIVEKDKLPW